MSTINVKILFSTARRYCFDCQTTYSAILDDIFKVIKEFFNAGSQLNIQVTIINVIQSVSRALDGEFKMYLPEVLTLMIGVLKKINLQNAHHHCMF